MRRRRSVVGGSSRRPGLPMWWNVLCLYLDWDLPTRAAIQHQCLKCTNVQNVQTNDYENIKCSNVCMLTIAQMQIQSYIAKFISLNTNTAERRDVWGCTSHTTKRFAKTQEIYLYQTDSVLYSIVLPERARDRVYNSGGNISILVPAGNFC